MRGKRCAGLKLMLLPAALLGAGAAAAEDTPPPAVELNLPATIVVLDASSSMNAKKVVAKRFVSEEVIR